jgi:hypothetical protein
LLTDITGAPVFSAPQAFQNVVSVPVINAVERMEVQASRTLATVDRSAPNVLPEANLEIPRYIDREGTPSPGNLAPRADDKGMLSFRSTLSNPFPLEPGQ